MRRFADGRSEVVAESVLAYDVDAEGRIVFTSGSAIQLVERDGGLAEWAAAPILSEARCEPCVSPRP
jgi:hypothetical protein